MLSIGCVRAAGVLTALVFPVLAVTQRGGDDVTVSPRARQHPDRAIVIDSHDDTTQRLIFDKNPDSFRHEALR